MFGVDRARKPNSAQSSSSNLFLPNVMESFAAVHLICQLLQSMISPHHCLFTIPVGSQKKTADACLEKEYNIGSNRSDVNDSFTPCNANLVTPLNSESVQGNFGKCRYARGLCLFSWTAVQS